jgi:HEAT repeat protein
MKSLSEEDLPRYRLAIDRAVRTWGLLADHVRARLTAAFRRAHGVVLKDGFAGGPDIPRSFPEACESFRDALRKLHEFDGFSLDFPWPQWGDEALAQAGPLPDIDRWLDSLKVLGKDAWQEYVIGPFLKHLGTVSLHFQEFMGRLERAKEAVIAASENPVATRLRADKAIRLVLVEEHERGEADRAQRRKRLHDLLTAALNAMSPTNEPAEEWVRRVTARLLSAGQEIKTQGWEDWAKENAEGEHVTRGLIGLMLQGGQKGIGEILLELRDSPADLAHLAVWLRSLQHDWSGVFDQGWLWWKLTGDLPIPEPQPTHATAAQDLDPGRRDEACEPEIKTPLPTEACDYVVIVEDASDESYLRCWMEKVLLPERWGRLSKRKFCVHAGGRPTPDEVNQMLDTIRQIHPEEHNLQPKAFVVADRDYRLAEELETERRKRQGKEFRQQSWHVWERVEIESYLVCPEVLVRHIAALVRVGSCGGEQPASLEAEVRAEVEAAIQMSREAARAQLIESFARWNRDEKKGWSISTVVLKAEEFLALVWLGERRLEWCDAKKVVLPRLREAIKRRWNVSLSDRDLFHSLQVPEIPAELTRVAEDIATFLEGSRWISAAESDQTGIRSLSEAMNNGSAEIRRSAAEALRAKGHRAVPALRRALKDEDVSVRREAALSLVSIGPQAARAARALTEALEDDDPEVRQQAASALGQIGPAAKEAVSALLRVLREDVAWAPRSSAATALGRIGEAGPIIQALTSALAASDTNLRINAAVALGTIGPDSAAAIPALLTAIADMSAGQEGVRQQAAFALGRIGQATAEVLQGLSRTIADPHRDPRRFAARALGDLGRGAETAVGTLIGALGDEDMFVRQDAAEALGKIGGPVAQIVPALVGQLSDEGWHVRLTAGQALGRIGSGAAPAISALETLADEDASGLVRVEAVSALVQIHGQTERSIQILVEQLRSPDVSVRIAAAKALQTIGPAASAAIPALAEALKDGHWNVRVHAAQAIGELGPAAVSVVEALAVAFADDYVENTVFGKVTWADGPVYDLVRAVVADALGKIGPPARAALPVLRETSRFQQAVRDAAAQAIRCIEQPPELFPV